MNIEETTALVLGASRGIGRAIARELAKKGARLVLPWYDWPEDVATLDEEFAGTERGHILLEADLRRREDVRTVAEKIGKEAKGLDILINNIERGGMPVVHGSYDLEINREQWQREMETTLHAKWLVFNACLPLLHQRERACVINLSSIAAETGRAGVAGLLFNDGYAAANRGIESLTRTWAKVGAPTIRVNEVMLGIIDSRHGPGTRGWDALSATERQKVLGHTLLERTGTPQDVAETVLFLVEKGDFITGSTVCLDGGFRLGGEEIPKMPPGIL